jgi:predicted Rossmann fold nucleotide-binding protein DprA/Smf involved in DNA uptake
MELVVSLPWLALALTPGLACRLSARLLRKLGSPERVFDAPLPELESCSLPGDLAARGLVIVRGMARGINAIGHHGALASNGRAIGVLGTGIDICYPQENKKLYKKVLERGAILSEFPLGTHPARKIFQFAIASSRGCL